MKVYNKRLHIAVPIKVFEAIYANREMDDIDNIIVGMLVERYQIDPKKLGI